MNRKQLPFPVKLAVTQQVANGEWTVGEAAESVGFSPQSVRRWVSSLPCDVVVKSEAVVEPALVEDADDSLDAETRKILDDVIQRRPHLRRRSLQDYVRRHYGLELRRRIVASYLREKGLCGPAASSPGNSDPRRFEASAPLELVQVDLFYIRRQGGGYFYGLSVLDDHSRMVLGLPVLTEQRAVEVLGAFRSVIEAWRAPGRVLTDRGPQFVSWRGRTAFQDYVEDELWATHVVAAAQHPQTLGKVERFHGTLRKEALTKREGYESRDEVQRVLDHYVAWYNYVRPHQSLDALTPAERFYGMRRPLAESVGPRGWFPGQGVYLSLNLGGRRLVIAGEGPERMQILWDEDRAGLPAGPSSEENSVPPVPSSGNVDRGERDVVNRLAKSLRKRNVTRRGH
jgi:transposase InsO family protein